MTIVNSFKHAQVKTIDNHLDTAVVEATSNYIPIGEFKEIFNAIETLVRGKNISKLIFDKRKLTVFHQPSMEWYFVEWKEKMFDLGLKTHRKILPNDDIFKQSVKIGREKIKAMHPNGKFTLMDIQYADSIEDAVNR